MLMFSIDEGIFLLCMFILKPKRYVRDFTLKSIHKTFDWYIEIAFFRTPPPPKEIIFNMHIPNNTIENKHTQTCRPSEISMREEGGKPPRKTLMIILGSVRFGIRTLRREPMHKKAFEKRYGLGEKSIAYFYSV